MATREQERGWGKVSYVSLSILQIAGGTLINGGLHLGMVLLGEHACLSVLFFLLIITVPFLIKFLISFTGLESPRPWWAVVSFAMLSLWTVLFLFAEIYVVSGISEGDVPLSRAKFWKCMFFSVSTFTTVGYGDLHAVTTPSRAAAAFEALSGYVILGIFVSVLTNMLRTRPSHKVSNLSRDVQQLS